MRIPRIGDQILVCVADGIKDADGGHWQTPPTIRPAWITHVWAEEGKMGVNALVLFDINDLPDYSQTPIAQTMHEYRTSLVQAASEDSLAINTYHYPDIAYDTLLPFTVEKQITFGREIIPAGAVGMYSTKTGKITFKREDVNNLAADHEPTYDQEFFQQYRHCLTCDEDRETREHMDSLMGDMSRVVDRIFESLGFDGLGTFKIGTAPRREYMKNDQIPEEFREIAQNMYKTYGKGNVTLTRPFKEGGVTTLEARVRLPASRAKSMQESEVQHA